MAEVFFDARLGAGLSEFSVTRQVRRTVLVCLYCVLPAWLPNRCFPRCVRWRKGSRSDAYVSCLGLFLPSLLSVWCCLAVASCLGLCSGRVFLFWGASRWLLLHGWFGLQVLFGVVAS